MADLSEHIKDLLGIAAGTAGASHLRQIVVERPVEVTTKLPDGRERKEKTTGHSALGDAYHGVMAGIYGKVAVYFLGEKVKDGADDFRDWWKGNQQPPQSPQPPGPEAGSTQSNPSAPPEPPAGYRSSHFEHKPTRQPSVEHEPTQQQIRGLPQHRDEFGG
ncbi:hypothetical protein HYU13_05090 [Candidatus Woesearchaeota archaeon]|nr:hypothetical protein [Candidatus Woesearchaeota archaeon]